jgi:hypothetical protein
MSIAAASISSVMRQILFYKESDTLTHPHHNFLKSTYRAAAVAWVDEEVGGKLDAAEREKTAPLQALRRAKEPQRWHDVLAQ